MTSREAVEARASDPNPPPCKSVLGKHLILVERLETQGRENLPLGHLPTGLTLLDSGYRQRRDSCLSGELGLAEQTVFPDFSQAISGQSGIPTTLTYKIPYFRVIVNLLMI